MATLYINVATSIKLQVIYDQLESLEVQAIYLACNWPAGKYILICWGPHFGELLHTRFTCNDMLCACSIIGSANPKPNLNDHGAYYIVHTCAQRACSHTPIVGPRAFSTDVPLSATHGHLDKGTTR